MVGYILCEVDGTLTVTIEPVFSCQIPSSPMKSFIQITSLSASTTAMYSASLVDNATFYNLNCHKIAPLA